MRDDSCYSNNLKPLAVQLVNISFVVVHSLPNNKVFPIQKRKTAIKQRIVTLSFLSFLKKKKETCTHLMKYCSQKRKIYKKKLVKMCSNIPLSFLTLFKERKEYIDSKKKKNKICINNITLRLSTK